MKTAKLGILLGMLVLLVGLAQAAANYTCTVAQPSTGDTISGAAQLVNITFTQTGKNVTNASITIGGTTYWERASPEKTRNVTFRISTMALSDATTYALTATVQNETQPEIVACTGLTGLLVDNTNPVPSITTPTSGSSNAQAFAVDASCVNASSAILYLNGNSYAMTMGGSAGAETCSYTFIKGAPPSRVYDNVYITATDLTTDSTSTSVVTWTVTEKSSAGKAALLYAMQQNQQIAVEQQQQVAEKKKKDTIQLIVALVVGALLLGGIGSRKK